MLRILIQLYLFLLVSSAWTQTNSLNIYSKNGNIYSFAVEDIKKITFGNITDIAKTKKYVNFIKKFDLFQNHPNPFNPKTVIKYDLPKSGFVNLKIYDINGKLLNEFSHYCQEGVNKTIWDGRNSDGNLVASGIYIYQVMFENSIITKRMVLLK